MKVLKFGGTSVGTAQRMGEVAKLIDLPESRVVVLSAMSGTTNALVAISAALYAQNATEANQLIETLEAKYRLVVAELYQTETYRNKGLELIQGHFDYLRSFTIDVFTVAEERAILAQGELLSTALFHFFLSERGTSSVLLPALNFMRLDENDEPDLAYIEQQLKAELAKYPGQQLFITQGYICRDTFGSVSNLKRGGSDYSASLIGAALQASEIQIWTDIDGMHNNDPRIVDKTFPIAELSFDEAAELAYFGAKILHPSSVLPAKLRNIPVRLLNTMQPEAKGTLITERSSGNNIKAVAAKDGIVAIKIKSSRMLLAYGFLRSVFEVFERFKTPIDMITTSEVAVSLTIDHLTHLEQIVDEISQFASVEVEKNMAIVCIVGDFLAERPGYAFQVFEALKDIPISMISYGGSKNNISVLVKSAHKNSALIALNNGLFVNQAVLA